MTFVEYTIRIKWKINTVEKTEINPSILRKRIYVRSYLSNNEPQTSYSFVSCEPHNERHT
jgi:hypothetical protein